MELERLIGNGFNTIDAVEELYALYLQDSQSVDPTWRDIFSSLDKKSSLAEKPSIKECVGTGDARVLELIHAYRCFGHLQADINPLATEPLTQPWQLSSEHWGFAPAELSDDFPTFGLLPEEKAPLCRLIEALQSIYCGKVGVEFMGFCSAEIESWLQQKIEPAGFALELTLDQKSMILQYLNKSELFESFLHMKYPGQKRFSLEGAETVIPMLAGIIDKGAEVGIEEFMIGMAHRGRLNVLANILNKSYSSIFSEFDEGYIQDSFEGTGDVKYHKGYFSDTTSSHGHKVKISVTPNPSHLEAVASVVEGQVKAKQVKIGAEGIDKVLPLLIHGDASISGQGVVYETLQLVNLPGYATGGTIHLVINNQIGFTTLPSEGRSTAYCTDIAKAFGAPIFHVNCEDPEGCFFAALLAVELRRQFKVDVFLDLICYRKYGHNESDEPAYTQPQTYQIIRKKRPIRELYRDMLVDKGEMEKEMVVQLEQQFKKSLQEALEVTKKPTKKAPKENVSAAIDDLIFRHVNTGVLPTTLRAVAEKLALVPEDFAINGKLDNLVKDRLSMIQDDPQARPIDWGMAELMAYGTLLHDGFDVRLSGQDCCRGTFSHRHAMWVDQQTSRPYFPLQHVGGKQGRFDVYNSPLSEYAVLGFEFGYSLSHPEALVLWEAQFGDFCNGAQIMIDQFISTGEQKWGQKFSVVLLLPHGYEGQGPEHSSARIERFLTLAGQNNMIVANPTTPAQLFHLLRRQLLSPLKKPLIVFTPKGLLRHPECVSSFPELTQGSFQEIVDDPQKPEHVETIACCSGRIYYDLISARSRLSAESIAIVRIEQLYPFDCDRMESLFKHYKGFKECVWIQEEPVNMGAYSYIAPLLMEGMPEGVKFRHIARPRSASPAVGSHALHDREHQALLEALFGRKQPSIFDLAGKKS